MSSWFLVDSSEDFTKIPSLSDDSIHYDTNINGEFWSIRIEIRELCPSIFIAIAVKPCKCSSTSTKNLNTPNTLLSRTLNNFNNADM